MQNINGPINPLTNCPSITDTQAYKLHWNNSNFLHKKKCSHDSLLRKHLHCKCSKERNDIRLFKLINISLHYTLGVPGGSDGKEFAYNAEDPGSISGLGRSSGEGHGHPLQASCLENPTERGTWKAIVFGVPKSQTLLSN